MLRGRLVQALQEVRKSFDLKIIRTDYLLPLGPIAMLQSTKLSTFNIVQMQFKIGYYVSDLDLRHLDPRSRPLAQDQDLRLPPVMPPRDPRGERGFPTGPPDQFEP
jgi:hypothetical protein